MIVENKLIENIVVGTFPKNIKIDLNMAKEMVNERLEFQNGKDYPVLIYANGFKIDTFEAREYMKKEGLKGMKAGAFVVRNSIEKMIATFFIKISPPPIPAKVFIHDQQAIEWLKQYR